MTARLEALEICSLRGLKQQTLRFGDGTHLVFGANGSGKSTVLEALALIGNLRSFRTLRWRALQPLDGGEVRIRALLRQQGERRTHELELLVDGSSRRLLVDGRLDSVDAWLERWPVLSITPADRRLVVGEPDARRSLLDSSCFLLDPPLIEVQRRYRRVLRQRNAALSSGRGDTELELWDRQLAATAARILIARRDLVEALRPRIERQLAELTEGAFTVTLSYREERIEGESNSLETLEKSLFERYTAGRGRDREIGYTTSGPHRHDLIFKSGNALARDLLSAGQLRMLVAAIRLAQLELFQGIGREAALVVDDVDVELDLDNLGRLMAAIRGLGQVFVTSARPEGFVRTVQATRIFEISEGRIEARETT